MKLQPEKHMVTRACTPQGQGPGLFHQVRWTAKLAEDEETLKQILAEWRSICCSPETRGSSRGCDGSPQLFKCCWQITQSCSPLGTASTAESHLAKVMLSFRGPHLMTLTWGFKDPGFLPLFNAILTQWTKHRGRNTSSRVFIHWSDVQMFSAVFDFYLDV